MKNMIQDRGYLKAGDIERIEYADGEVAEKPVYAKIDTYLYPMRRDSSMLYSCFVEALWVTVDGTVHIRREPVEQMKIFFHKTETSEKLIK